MPRRGRRRGPPAARVGSARLGRDPGAPGPGPAGADTGRDSEPDHGAPWPGPGAVAAGGQPVDPQPEPQWAKLPGLLAHWQCALQVGSLAGRLPDSLEV